MERGTPKGNYNGFRVIEQFASSADLDVVNSGGYEGEGNECKRNRRKHR